MYYRVNSIINHRKEYKLPNTDAIVSYNYITNFKSNVKD